MRRSFLLAATLILTLTQVSWGITARTITYQGVLKDSNGDIVADGPYSMTFRLFDVETGGTELWSETHASVNVQDGVFSVELGSITAMYLGGAAMFDVPYWLEIDAGSTTMSPRTELTAVPYAIGATSVYGSWNELQSRGRLGINVGPGADTTKAVVITQEGRVGIGTTIPDRDLHIVSGHYGGIQLTDSSSGLYRALLMNYENSGGRLRLYDVNGVAHASIGGYAFNGTQAYFTAGNIGIGTNSPEDQLHVLDDSAAYVKLSGYGDDFNYSGLRLEKRTDGTYWQLLHRSHTSAPNNFLIQYRDGFTWYNNLSITPGGNVGIGTLNPGAKLEVVGTIKADTVMIDTTTRYHSIPAPAFEPTSNSIGYGRSRNYLYPLYGAAAFYAPINLPHGATIKGLLVTMADDSTNNIYFELNRVDYSTGNYENLLGMNSIGESAVFTISRAYNIAVDNNNYGYVIRVYFEGAGSSTGFKLIGARVQYEIASPLP